MQLSFFLLFNPKGSHVFSRNSLELSEGGGFSSLLGGRGGWTSGLSPVTVQRAGCEPSPRHGTRLGQRTQALPDTALPDLIYRLSRGFHT